jgi:hypothetical protein
MDQENITRNTHTGGGSMTITIAVASSAMEAMRITPAQAWVHHHSRATFMVKGYKKDFPTTADVTPEWAK